MENIGPVTDDRTFFGSLDLSFEGMEAVRSHVLSGDYASARTAFAQFIDGFLDRKRFFSIQYERPENLYKLPGESDEEAAVRLNRPVMVSVGIPSDFSSTGVVDWFSNPTENGYEEWTWQLSRHNEIKMLAHLYHETGKEEYAHLGLSLLSSWIRQAVAPSKNVKGNETLCWRTIECGIRMGGNWPYIVFAFSSSRYFTASVAVDIFKSIYEHANRIIDAHMQGNWLVMEMNGLEHIAILYPFFRDSGKWRKIADGFLCAELSRQIYPDGFQYELSTNYHEVVLNNYRRFFDVATAFGKKVPAGIMEILRKATEATVDMMMPDGRLPDINDGALLDVRTSLEEKRRMFPDSGKISWVLSDRKGKAPDELSVAFPYSGFAVFRDGWGTDAVWGMLDAAPFGKAHQHEDKLSLLAYAHSRLLLAEGGNYAYDDSPMRRYILSSRSHNTILVDGKGQDRRSSYLWKDEDIEKLSGMEFSSENGIDRAKGFYSEAYDGIADSIAISRTVWFVRGASPSSFFVVLDEAEGSMDHVYSLLWHVDDELVSLEDGIARFENISFESFESSYALVRGQEDPEVQGFIATGTKQGSYRKVNTLVDSAAGRKVRFLTLIKFDDEKIKVDFDGDGVSVRLPDGRILALN